VRSFLACASLVLFFLLTAVAGGATIAPSSLVLTKADVPAGYRLNPHLSGPRTAAQDAVDYPELHQKYVAWGRLGGYQIRFDMGEDSIVSRADVFRAGSGTRQMFTWFVTAVGHQRSAIRLRPKPLALGDTGVSYSWGRAGVRFTIAVWRYRRVFSVVGGGGLSRAQVLTLAHAQQRRVAAALP
jgi:hypothetical protein